MTQLQSPTVDQELRTLQEFDNYNGEAYSMVVITSRWDVSI